MFPLVIVLIPILPMGADFIQESTPQSLCGPQIALEGVLSLYCAP